MLKIPNCLRIEIPIHFMNIYVERKTELQQFIFFWERNILLVNPRSPSRVQHTEKRKMFVLLKRLYPFKTINSGSINCLKRIHWDLTQLSIQPKIINKHVQNICPFMAFWICIWQFDLLGKPKFPFPGATYLKAHNAYAFETFIYV